MRIIIPGKLPKTPELITEKCKNCGCEVEFSPDEAIHTLNMDVVKLSVSCPTEGCNYAITRFFSRWI